MAKGVSYSPFREKPALGMGTEGFLDTFVEHVLRDLAITADLFRARNYDGRFFEIGADIHGLADTCDQQSLALLGCEG